MPSAELAISPQSADLLEPTAGPLSTAPAEAFGLAQTELAQILGVFDQASRRLHDAHAELLARTARLERELREANEQLERARHLAALGQMAAGIAHEVRNPLGSIRLYARILEQDLADRPAEQAVALKIAGAVRGLDAVVGDVLAFARELRITPEPVDPAQLLDQAFNEAISAFAAEHAGAKQSTIRVQRDYWPANDPVELCADPALLHRALVNLIRNALQAMSDPERPGGGTLTLSCSRREVIARDGRAQPMVALSVADTGPGIPPEIMDRLFQPFFTTRASGTGLGLAITHRIIDAHLGRIFVHNRSDQLPDPQTGGQTRQTGAIFEVTLPARSAVFADQETVG